MKSAPVCLKGGFMHKMYKVETEQGTYAHKLLNPFVMQRETAMENYSKAEQIELLLVKQNVFLSSLHYLSMEEKCKK